MYSVRAHSLQVEVLHGLLGDADEHVADDLALVLGRVRVAQQRRLPRAPARLAHARAALSELTKTQHLLKHATTVLCGGTRRFLHY